MFSSTPLVRKRTRDEDDYDTAALQPADKRSCSIASRPFAFITSSPRGIPWPDNPHIPRVDSAIEAISEDESLRSTISDAGSTTDSSIDMDLDTTTSTIIPTQSWTTTTDPDPSTAPTSWSSSAAPDDLPASRKTSTSSTNSLNRPVRPRPWPLQTSPPRTALHNTHQDQPTYPPTQLHTTPSNPQTPTALLAGRQFSQLSMNDMEIDTPPTSSHPTFLPDPDAADTYPAHMALSSSAPDALSSPALGGGGSGSPNSTFIRRQRQRSGAFISSPGSTRPGTPRGMHGLDSGGGGGGGTCPGTPSTRGVGFKMGYREDCERCRMRVPGHMNHFLGT